MLVSTVAVVVTGVVVVVAGTVVVVTTGFFVVVVGFFVVGVVRRVVAVGRVVDVVDDDEEDDVLEGGEVITIGADDDAEEAIRTMKDHGVRRLPVIDGQDLVGMVSQGDIARALPDARVGDLVGAISDAPPNN